MSDATRCAEVLDHPGTPMPKFSVAQRRAPHLDTLVQLPSPSGGGPTCLLRSTPTASFSVTVVCEKSRCQCFPQVTFGEV